MSLSRLFRTVVAGLALLAAAPLASRAAAVEAPDVIHFGGFGQGFGKPYGVALLAIAQEKGFIAAQFDDKPVKLDFTYFAGTGPAINEAIANGQLDFAQYGALPNIIGKAGGLPTRILASYGGTTIFGAARKGTDIRSVKDLKGRKVTLQKGTILHWALLKALEANGLTIRDVTLVDLKTSDQFAALAAGSVDAAIGSSSLLSLRDQGIVDIFYTSKDVGPKATGFGSITVTQAFATKYPEATERVARGLIAAAAWLGKPENRDEALAIWTKSGLPLAALQGEFEGVALKDAFNPRLDDFFANQYRDAIAFSRDEKLIRGNIDVAAWFDPKPIDDAIASLHLDGFWPQRGLDGLPLGSKTGTH